MADKIDNFFIDYFSGKISKLLKLRKLELQAKTVDENVNASRSTTLTRVAELQLLKEQGDRETAFLVKELQYMELFLSTLSDEQKQLLVFRYDRRNKYSWFEVADAMLKSERQCKRYLDSIKEEFKADYWPSMMGDVSKYV